MEITFRLLLFLCFTQCQRAAVTGYLQPVIRKAYPQQRSSTRSTHKAREMQQQHQQPKRLRSIFLRLSRGFDDSDAASKGLVAGLTNTINWIRGNSARSDANRASSVEQWQHQQRPLSSLPPTSPHELTERIRQDYITYNYLWTGDIDLSCFEPSCRFTDPTISFTGTEQFVQNLQNLRPIVDALTRRASVAVIGTARTAQNNASRKLEEDDSEEEEEVKSKSDNYNDEMLNRNCRSELLDIQLFPEFVQTRWKMVGRLVAVPWQPTINVIGRTKFWYRNSIAPPEENEDSSREAVEDENEHDDTSVSSCQYYRIYFYDEEWEIPAWKALLQLVTPAGMMSSTTTN